MKAHQEVIDCPELKTRGSFSGYTAVKYYPSYQHNLNNQAEYLSNFCQKSNINLPFNKDQLTIKTHKDFSDISLVVSYNWPKDLTYLNVMMHYQTYGSYFKNIIFCSNEPFSDEFEKVHDISMIHIEVDTAIGILQSYCTAKAIELNLKTKGFFHAGNDLLFKFWNLQKFDSNKIWIYNEPECYSTKSEVMEFIKKDKPLRLDPNFSNRNWWNNLIKDGIPFPVWDNLSNEIDQMRNGNIKISTENRRLVNRFMQQTLRNFPPKNSDKNLFLTVCEMTGTDAFYVPAKVFRGYHFMSHLFRKYKVHHEIANVAILVSLDKKENILPLGGIYKWSSYGCTDRNKFWNDGLYSKFETTFHPVKIAEIDYDEGGWNRTQYCDYFIRDIFKRVLN